MKNKNNKEISSMNERIRIFCLGGLDEDGKNMMGWEDIVILICSIVVPLVLVAV